MEFRNRFMKLVETFGVKGEAGGIASLIVVPSLVQTRLAESESGQSQNVAEAYRRGRRRGSEVIRDMKQ